MRMAFLFAAALSIAACSSGPPAPSPSNVATPAAEAAPVKASGVAAVTVPATKGLILAELAYNTAGTTIVKLTQAGLIVPGSPAALTIRDLNRKASRALEVARAARSVGDQAAAVARAVNAVADLSAALPKEK